MTTFMCPEVPRVAPVSGGHQQALCRPLSKPTLTRSSLVLRCLGHSASCISSIKIFKLACLETALVLVEA